MQAMQAKSSLAIIDFINYTYAFSYCDMSKCQREGPLKVYKVYVRKWLPVLWPVFVTHKYTPGSSLCLGITLPISVWCQRRCFQTGQQMFLLLRTLFRAVTYCVGETRSQTGLLLLAM